ncbi:MAG: hypothetical protein LPK45_07515 [Bacteroidota bacterium]|nr:hypothetical protein [Bacteroidota bacterium]MDX5469669.1 hypothetical protein [Bacteroidota bacterium]
MKKGDKVKHETLTELVRKGSKLRILAWIWYRVYSLWFIVYCLESPILNHLHTLGSLSGIWLSGVWLSGVWRLIVWRLKVWRLLNLTLIPYLRAQYDIGST